MLDLMNNAVKNKAGKGDKEFRSQWCSFLSSRVREGFTEMACNPESKSKVMIHVGNQGCVF